MSFGSTNALTVFMDFMNRVFKDFLDTFLIVFTNDILLYSKKKTEHEDHYRKVLETHEPISSMQSFRSLSFC